VTAVVILLRIIFQRISTNHEISRWVSIFAKMTTTGQFCARISKATPITGHFNSSREFFSYFHHGIYETEMQKLSSSHFYLCLITIRGFYCNVENKTGRTLHRRVMGRFFPRRKSMTQMCAFCIKGPSWADSPICPRKWSFWRLCAAHWWSR
jgi:hypothetical protein